MNIVKSHIEWALTYKGEIMFSPIVSSYEEARSYKFNPQNPEGSEPYGIVSRIVVTETSDWAEWK